jgi:hypothetical protein
MAATELKGAAKAAHEKKAGKAAGKLLPGFNSQGRWPDFGMKDTILAQPICPKSQIRGKMVQGHYEPPEIGPEDFNCQLGGGMWWRECEARGHDPYFTNRQRIVTRTTFKLDDEGDKIPVEKRVLVEDKMLNVTSISSATRLGSGQSVRWKKRYFGFKNVSDFGYAETCQISRCQNQIKVVSKLYGGFCSQEHLQLVAVEENEIVLIRADHKYAVDADGSSTKARRRRKRQMRNAVDDPEMADMRTIDQDGSE